MARALRFGAWILAEADRLAAFSEDKDRLTRVYLSREHRAAADHLAGLMRAAGLAPRLDALGNLVGRLDGAGPLRRPVMLGSHMDSVRNAGRYDGPLGVLAAIAVVGALNREGRRLPFPVEVVAFGDEEGARFGATMIGSRAFAGRFDPAWLTIKDAAGITMAEAIRAFGGDVGAIPALDRRADPPLCFLEVHIEQGPVLIAERLPVGIVTAIAGANRARCRVTGKAGHAGTVPMAGRHDALAAASEMVLAIERIARGADGLVATVGRLEVAEGAVNVIPGAVEFTLDLRHGEDRVRKRALAEVKRVLGAIAKARKVTAKLEVYYDSPAAPCDPRLQELLASAVASRRLKVCRLTSGAGHDAMEISRICPVAMLFVRCGNGGISHHPDETITAADADAAAEVLLSALVRLADDPGRFFG
jgi:hydantoinase/carbamoylase family amidase